MEWEDVRRPGKPAVSIGEDLATVSIGELESRIGLLQAEIVRIETEIVRKRRQQDAAASLFKPGGKS